MRKLSTMGWAGYDGDRLRLDRRKLTDFVRERGGTVEDDSSGSWTVIQLVAPKGFLWSEGIRFIRVEWRKGEASEDACRIAWQRITPQKFIPIPKEDAELYAED